MKLKCSRGCVVDSEHPFHRNTQPGDKCKGEISYDRMHVPSTTYCQRVLNPVCDKCGGTIKKQKRCRVCKAEYDYRIINNKVICKSCRDEAWRKSLKTCPTCNGRGRIKK